VIGEDHHPYAGGAGGIEHLLPGAAGMLGVFGMHVQDGAEILENAARRESAQARCQARAGIVYGLQMDGLQPLNRCPTASGGSGAGQRRGGRNPS
jgi:nickel-dependent lactate racemase